MQYGHRGQVQLASGLNVLAAIWLIIAPFVLGFDNVDAAVANSVILGIVVGVLALVRTFGAYGALGVSWVNVILGIWLIISPFVIGFTNTAGSVANTVIFGIVVGLLALWSALATQTEGEHQDHRLTT